MYVRNRRKLTFDSICIPISYFNTYVIAVFHNPYKLCNKMVIQGFKLNLRNFDFDFSAKFSRSNNSVDNRLIVDNLA